MPFETTDAAPRRIAVVGGGISGMGAAYFLSKTHHVTLIEAEPRLGGHARTVVAGKRGDQPVDTGFIVFNNVNYPNMVRLFGELGVPVADSDMSFGAYRIRPDARRSDSEEAPALEPAISGHGARHPAVQCQGIGHRPPGHDDRRFS